MLSELADTENDALSPFARLPSEPADVLQVGASETVKIAVELLAALPSGFSTLI